MNLQHRLVLGVLLLAQQIAPQCGGTSSSPAPVDNNSVAIVVNTGPTRDSINTAFVSVTVCVPGQSSSCQTIDDVAIDTGSSGLRLLGSVLTLPLTQQTTAGGAGIDECFPFQDGYTWGPVAAADVTIGSKQAKQVSVQIVGAQGAPVPPNSCTSSGLVNEDTVAAFGANGILGIGLFRQDCGVACTVVGSSNPGLYYACPATGCQVTAETLANQLQNPVWMFADDNNGVVIRLPSATPVGQPTLAGTLLFGIGTQSNNALGSATVLTLDAAGNFTTRYSGTSVSGFIDSGSNGLFFLDRATANIPMCSRNTDFYCPSSTLDLSATNTGANGRFTTVNFSIANADMLPNFPVLPELGGPFAGSFDWGLPFFYGRNVFTAIEGQSTSGGVGPYFAY